MRKNINNVIILSSIVISIIFISYFLFSKGITNKIQANLIKLNGKLNNNSNMNDHPVITMVINSSGEKLVNEDVALTAIVESKYKVDKAYYSFDMKNWYDKGYDINYKENTSIKFVFNKSMNETVYIKVENSNGYQSYVYKTIVKIDKKAPIINVSKQNDKIIINALDNVGLASILYSFDGVNWDEKKIEGNSYSEDLLDINYKYYKAVDMAGNISKIKELND